MRIDDQDLYNPKLSDGANIARAIFLLAEVINEFPSTTGSIERSSQTIQDGLRWVADSIGNNVMPETIKVEIVKGEENA